VGWWGKFYDAVGNNPAILIFLRYYGCPVCRWKWQNKQEIELVSKKGGAYCSSTKCAGNACFINNKEDWPFIIISDLKECVSTLWVEAGGIIKYLHPAVWLRQSSYLSRFLHGKFEGKKHNFLPHLPWKRIRSLSTLIMGKIGDVPSLTKMINAYNINGRRVRWSLFWESRCRSSNKMECVWSDL